MIRLLAATLVSLLTLGIANPATTYLPTIIGQSTATRPVGEEEPSPYNIQAQAVVLQLPDLAAGFLLDKSEAMTLTDETVTWGAVTAHRTQFSHEPAQPAELAKIESAAVVFLTVAGASQAYNAEVAYTAQAPNYSRIDVPTYGDATAAFRSTGTLNGQSIATYYVFFSKGNVWGGIRIEGAPDMTALEDAVPYIQVMLERIE